MTKELKDYKIKPEKKIENAVIFLHGYGANGKDLIEIGNIWKKNLPDTIFLSPNAPFECPWGGESFQWFELTSIAPDKIGEGLKLAGPYLNFYIDSVCKNYNLLNEKIFFVGFSQGTMMALYHLCKRKLKCGGLVGFSGLLFEDENFDRDVLSKFPITLYHGKNDEVINYEFTVKAHEKLSKLGFEINYNLSELLGHGIDEKGISIGESFIKKFFYI
jgi:phospholipase/carboxylesterase